MAKLKNKSEIQTEEKPDYTKPVAAAPSSHSRATQATLILVVVWKRSP